MSEHAIMTRDESIALSREIFAKMESNDPQLHKEAADQVTEFTRTNMREEGFYRRIIPMLPVQNNQLTRQVSTDRPAIVVDREAQSPAAVTIPFATTPVALYIRGFRYMIVFDRIATPRFSKDVDELRTWEMDIRMVISDNSIKDMLAEEDGKFLRAVNTALVGPNLTVPTSGTVQYDASVGPMSRDSLWDSLKVMPNTPSSLEVHTVLVNNITIKEVCKFTHNEMGGTLSEDIMRNGWTLKEFMGVQWLITIKKGLVPTNTLYQFADPKFIGKSYELVPVTMFMKREHIFFEFFSYETIGGAIGWTSGLARIDFDQ